MKYYLSITFLFSFFIHSQELTSNEYKMNSVKIIHVENNLVYRIGYEQFKNHYLKKSADGENIATLQVSDKDKEIICRGLFFRDNHFYNISTRDNLGKTSITLQKIDMDLQIVDEKVIFSAPIINKNNKAQVFFESNENGFILIRNYSKGRKVKLESFIYDFRSNKIHTSELEYLSKRYLKILDFELSNELKGALILDLDVSYGELNPTDLKTLETYLVYVEPEQKMTPLKLTIDKNYFERSFNLTFNREDLFIANLNFHNPSNILSGYTIKQYKLEDGNDLKVTQDLFFAFNDYTSRKEWGPIFDEVQKKYEKSKDSYGTKYKPFAALEITNLIVQKNKEAIIVIREFSNQNPYSDKEGGITFSKGSTPKRFEEFQVAKLDFKTKNILWWNRIYNAPHTNGAAISTQLYLMETMFWTDNKVNSKSRIYYPYLDNNKLVLLYPTYLNLYDESGELKSELIDQFKLTNIINNNYYSGIGKSEIDITTGHITNSLLMGELEGTGHAFSSKAINLEGFFITSEKVIVPIENPWEKTSILKVSNK